MVIGNLRIFNAINVQISVMFVLMNIRVYHAVESIGWHGLKKQLLVSN